MKGLSKKQSLHSTIKTVVLMQMTMFRDNSYHTSHTFNLQSDVVPILILLIHSSEKCLGEL